MDKRPIIEFSKGDRDTGYQLSRLFSISLFENRFDVVVGKYPPGSSQPIHKDRCDGFKIYRGAFVLRAVESGGKLIGDSVISLFGGRVNFMRPDLHEHEVTPVEGDKTRYSLLTTVFIKDRHYIEEDL